MNKSEIAESRFEKWLLRDRLDDFDFTSEIRKGLIAKGISFTDVTRIETEKIVEEAIKPLRDEINRTRTGWQAAVELAIAESRGQKEWYQCRGCGESYAVGVKCDLCELGDGEPSALLGICERGNHAPLYGSKKHRQPHSRLADCENWCEVPQKPSDYVTTRGPMINAGRVPAYSESGAAQEVSPLDPPAGAPYEFDVIGYPKSRLWKVAGLLCEIRGHIGFRPCEFCRMQSGIKLKPGQVDDDIDISGRGMDRYGSLD